MSRGERLALAIALGAATGAYALAYFVGPNASKWSAIAPALLLPAIALAIHWRDVPAPVAGWALAILRILLVLAAALVIFARQFPLLRADLARQGGVVLGGLLALLATLLISGGRGRRSEGAVLAIVGLLMMDGMDPSLRTSFLPLASVSGAALWAYGFLRGGPGRLSIPGVMFAGTGAAFAWAIAWLLPAAQPHVQDFLGRAYTEARTGLSNRSQLGEFERLAQSRRIVARVWTTKPQLLRTQVFTYFDGRGWSAAPRPRRVLEDLGTETIARTPAGPLVLDMPGRLLAAASHRTAGTLVETKILTALSFDDGWGILVPARPVLLVWPGGRLTIDDLGLVVPEESGAALYGVANGTENPASGTSDADLSLPARLDDRMRQLAARLRSGASSDHEIIRRTVNYLSTYRYTLDVGPRLSNDPLTDFVFEKRAGYCEYFATAAAVLLRLQGIPSRFIKGVAVRPESWVAGHYVVREFDAHAWVEAYVSGGGWIEVDPTPADGYALTHAGDTRSYLADRWEAIQAWWTITWERFVHGAWPRLKAIGLLAVRRAGEALREISFPLAAIALTFVGFWLYARRRWVAKVSRPIVSMPRMPADLRAGLRRLERLWNRHGRPRPAASGLREHLDGIPPDEMSPAERAASRLVVECHYRVCYGGRVLSSETITELQEAIKALR